MGAEFWTDVVGYDGLYQVSCFGKIMSLNYRKTGVPKLLTPFKNKKGYLCVELWINKTRKTQKIHRLVAEAFLLNPLNLPQINHIDEDKTNNDVFNLEWCSSIYNLKHGTRSKRSGESRINHTLLSKKVIQLGLNGTVIKEWDSLRECGRNGFNASNISACCKGKLKTTGGYKWKYL